MATEHNKKWKERINYVIDDSTGKGILVGTMVNHPSCTLQAENMEELIGEAKISLRLEKDMIDELLAAEEPFDIREMTIDGWEARDDNIVYWELERTIRLLKKPEVQEKWKEIILQALIDSDNGITLDDQASMIMEALINQPVE